MAAMFWSALAVAFGASSAAVWWELNVEPRAARAGADAARLPITRIQGASRAVLSPTTNPLPARVGGDDDASSHSGGSTTPSEHAAHSSTETTSECLGRFFPARVFPTDHRLDYVCAEGDLRNVKEHTHRAVITHAEGQKTEGLVSWGTLGWYQLPLLATARLACCGESVPPARLPRQHGLCDGLGPSIDALAKSASVCLETPDCARETVSLTPSTNAGVDLSDKAREFAGRVQCLHRENRQSVYGYGYRPSLQNREEFETRVRRAALALSSNQ